jgi:hypothetical protein
MARVYATSTDYTPEQLRLASSLVDVLLRGVVYATDADGMPTDPDVAQAMSDATLAIAGELDATGATLPGSTQEWDSVRMATVALSGRKAKTGATLVAGLPVPAAALVALASIGVPRVVAL